MKIVKISDNYEELDTLFTPRTLISSFQNRLLFFEICSMEAQNPPEFVTTSKSYFLKKLTFKDSEKLDSFLSFLEKFLDLQNNTNIPGLLRIQHVYRDQGSLFLVQRNYKSTISTFNKSLTEIEVLVVLKHITKLYYQLKQEDFFEDLLENSFPLKKIEQNIVFYYRRLPNDELKKLSRWKLRLDLLMFDNKDSSEGKLDGTTFHLEELKKLMMELFKLLGANMGVCTKNLIRNLGPDCHWRELLTHPLFKADFEIEPNLEYWKIKEEDRRKAAIEAEEMKANVGKTDDITIKIKNNWNYNLEEPNFRLDDFRDKEKNQSSAALLEVEDKNIKKNQVKPITNHYQSKSREIVLEDHENREVKAEKDSTVPLNNKKDFQEKKTNGCGDCRCI